LDAQRRRIDEEIADIQKQCASWKRCTGAAPPPQASTQEEQTDRRGEEKVVGPYEASVGRVKASRHISRCGVMKQFAVNGELAAFDCCAPMQRKDWSG